ncbi:MAG: Chemotaxis protein CheW [Firmicutes bacterium]|nr:Chemotaxis protein CheW [candidate division NPL-UPA2 bacterium]
MVNRLQLVIFSLGDEQYGIDTAQVKEITRMEAITPIPRCPQFVEGVLNLRGQILPVVCLHKRFALPARTDTQRTRIVIVDSLELKVGLIVDAVSEVSDIAGALVTPAPALASASFVTGVMHHGGTLISLLDPVRLFSAEPQLGVSILG